MNDDTASTDAVPLRPAVFCARLLATLDASDGRRKRRQRDTTPDALGLELKRALLAQAIVDDPEPDRLEAWLIERCALDAVCAGALRAMALEVLEEWRMSERVPGFREWLDAGAPSADA